MCAKILAGAGSKRFALLYLHSCI